jgi:hypothetical protein
LRLVETAGLHGRYACLSHPWGNDPPLVFKTTDQNYHESLEAIPFLRLSKVFQHGIIAGFNHNRSIESNWA